MGLDRRARKEFREAPWTSVDELRAFVDGIVPASRKDVELLLDVLLDPKLDHGPRHKNRCSALKSICNASADPSLFVPLAKALGANDPLLRAAIAAVLPRCNDPNRHGVLCAQLGASDPEVRTTAVRILEPIAGPQALKALTELVAQPAFPGRRDALDLMVPRARHRALDLIAAVLGSGTTPDRLRAVELAGDRDLMAGDPERAIQVIVGTLTDPDPRVATVAYEAFANLADADRFVEALEPKLASRDVSPVLVEALGHVRSARTVDLLASRMRRGPGAVQVACVKALRRIATTEVVAPLVEALHLEEATVRRTASESLNELAADGAVEVSTLLLHLLKSPQPHIRRTAAQLAANVQTGGEALTAQLLEALRDEDWWVRERVLDAIVELGLPELATGLVGFLGDESPVIRRYAIFGLLRLRDPATLGAILRTAVTDPEWWVREQAVQAAGELRDDRAVPYLEALVRERDDLRVAALEALQTLGEEDVLLGFAELAADDDPSVRLAILEILGNLDRGREASFYIQACANDPEPRVQRVARALLDRWEMAKEGDASAAVGLLDRLLVAASRKGADDLLLSPGRQPYVKHLGSVVPISKGVLDGEEMERMILPILSGTQREQLAAGKDVDLSYDVPGFELRYRINVFRQLAGLAAVFRRIHQHVPQLDELGLPEVVKGFADFPNGLVLVGGPTGSGKSTTLAALIDYINTHHGAHIVTIEDPIEVVHPQRESLINQREVGTHAPSFAHALRATLRQDPDVILVGELRDRETIEFAVNAAETGHLVFATVHTTSAATSLDRLIHACEPSRQAVIRSMLAESLRAVLCQQLLRRRDDDTRRVLACEVLINNDAVSALVRKDKAFQLPTVMLTHRDHGMQLMDDDLQRLVREGIVTPDDASLKALDKPAFAAFLDALAEGQDTMRGSIAPPRPSVPPGRPSAPPGAVSGVPGRPSFAPPGRDVASGEG